MHECQAGSAENTAQVSLAVRVTQRRQEFYAVARMGLDREGENTVRRKDGREAGENRRQIVDVDEDIGGDREPVARTIGFFLIERDRQIAGERSTPTSRSTLERKAAPARPVPQPRSSMEIKRIGRCAPRISASTACNRSCGAR